MSPSGLARSPSRRPSLRSGQAFSARIHPTTRSLLAVIDPVRLSKHAGRPSQDGDGSSEDADRLSKHADRRSQDGDRSPEDADRLSKHADRPSEGADRPSDDTELAIEGR